MKKRNIILGIMLLTVLLGCKLGIEKKLYTKDVVQNPNSEKLVIKRG
jgi:lipoprotein